MQRKLVLERDRYTCFYCGQAGNTIDHIIPIVQGGTDHISNLVTACQWCNSAKSNASVENFMIFITWCKNRSELFTKSFPENKTTPRGIGRLVRIFKKSTGIVLHSPYKNKFGEIIKIGRTRR